MKLKNVALVFENCEYGTVQAVDIRSIRLTGITETISGQGDRDISFSKSVKNVYLHIRKNDVDLTERLFKYNDITQIELNYDNGMSRLYYVEWPSTSEYNNSRQKVKESHDGEGIWIIVSDEESV